MHQPIFGLLTAGFMGKKKAGRMKFWTTAEFDAALAQVEKPAFRIAFMLLYWLGLRVGECLALTPADILPSHTCRIDKTHHRKNGEDDAGPPKSDNSIRDVSMPSFLYDEVEAYIQALYEIRPDDRIFYFTHGTLNRELNRAAVAAGVQQIRIAMSTYSHMYPDKMDTLAVDLDRRAGGIGATADDLGAVAGRLEKAEKEAGKK